MTETDLIEGVAALLRAYSNEPLASMEVHTQPQIGYEDADGFVEVSFSAGSEVFEAIGNQAADEVTLRIYAQFPFADTVVNRQKLETLCAQIRYELRTNRGLTTSSGTATRNQQIRWNYGFASDGADARRQCEVFVTYRIPQGSTAP